MGRIRPIVKQFLPGFTRCFPLMVLCLLLNLWVYGQTKQVSGVHYPQHDFIWPLKGEIDLSGNFGDVRANHFHSGIDLRTGKGQTGIPVYASADGYISRINVSSKGYGKAIYITHANGYTTVYGHLSAFAPSYAGLVEAHHYKIRSFEMVWYPGEGKIPVRQGDLIAYSGNTGGSGGPHLHFEIRDTRTEEVINPLLFGLPLDDHSAPEINRLVVYRMDPASVETTGTNRFHEFHLRGNETEPSVIRVDPGVYSFGVTWSDKLHSGGFNMGIPYASVSIDGKKVFEQNLERFAFSESRYVNCYIDHPIMEENEKEVVKLFVDDGNRITIFPTALNHGRINALNGVNHTVRIVIRDFSGHADSVKFTLQGKKGPGNTIFNGLSPLAPDSGFAVKRFYPGKPNHLEYSDPSMSIRVHCSGATLYDTVQFSIGKLPGKGGATGIYSILNTRIPVHDTFTLGFKPTTPWKNKEKYLVLRYTSEGKIKAEGGTWKHGYLTVYPKNLGRYFCDIDTLPPVISGFTLSGRKFYAGLRDDLSGIDIIETLVDGQWVLTDFEAKDPSVSGTIPAKIPPGKHEFQISMTDTRGNKNIFRQTITLP